MFLVDVAVVFLLCGALYHNIHGEDDKRDLVATVTPVTVDTIHVDTNSLKETTCIDSIVVDSSVSVRDSLPTYEPLKKEFFAFGYKPYDYTPVKYTERELVLLTNVLYRESTSSKTVNEEIDQYLVVICAINRLYVNNNQPNESHVHTIMDIIYRTKSFTEPKRKFTTSFDNKHWVKCYNITKNVLDAKIPSSIS